jgi:ABC-type antimicrobial peptide transport system permease subunit
MREPITPTAYIPILSPPPDALRSATFLIKTTLPNPLAMAPLIRREVTRARPEIAVSNVRTQLEINQAQTVRERLLATLAVFFAGVAILLAGIGLYGVLDYSVLQRRRELGIRIAIGAPASDLARRVTVEIFTFVILGTVLGCATGLLLEPYAKTLLYHVERADLRVVVVPLITIFVAATLAAGPPLLRAIRIDPSAMLRSD